MNEKDVFHLEQEYIKQRAHWSDEAILAEIRALPVLPDEYNEQSDIPLDDSHWGEPETDHHLALYLALVTLVRDRKLREGVPLLMERVSYGDMGESMRGLWGDFRRAYGPDEATWTDLCFQMVASPYRGCRLWTMEEIGCTEDERSLAALINGLHDPAHLVREWAAGGMESLCEHMPQTRPAALQAFQEALAKFHEKDDQYNLLSAIQIIQKMQDDPSE